MSIDVILPCLNEADALPRVLRNLPEGYTPIVVDNGSTDGSAAIARVYGAQVIEEQQRGFGAAVHAGLLASTTELVAVFDADGSFDPRDLPRLVDALIAGGYDLVLGYRMPKPRRAWQPHARLANRVLILLIWLRTGLRLHDLGPMRVMRRETWLGLDLRDRRSGYPLEMLLNARRQHLSIGEVPVTYYPRIGQSKVTGTLRGTWHAIKDMQALLRTYRREA